MHDVPRIEYPCIRDQTWTGSRNKMSHPHNVPKLQKAKHQALPFWDRFWGSPGSPERKKQHFQTLITLFKV